MIAQGATRFTSRVLRNRSTVVPVSFHTREMPALLTRTSSLPKVLSSPGRQGPDVVRVGHLELHRVGVAAAAGDPLDDGLTRRHVARRDDHGVSQPRERRGDLLPEPLVGARDERNPATLADGHSESPSGARRRCSPDGARQACATVPIPPQTSGFGLPGDLYVRRTRASFAALGHREHRQRVPTLSRSRDAPRVLAGSTRCVR